MLDRLYPLIPAQLPDGTKVWEERGKARDVVDALRDYDPRYSLVRNFEANAWEVWRHNEGGNASRSMVVPGDRLPEPREVLDWLLAHDTWRGYDPLAAHEAYERDRAARVSAELDELEGAHADRMAFELADEYAGHMPASRPMFLAPNRHRRMHTKEARERGLLTP